MHQQPAVKHVMHYALPVQSALFVAKILQVRQFGPKPFGKLDAQLAEYAGSLRFVGQRAPALILTQKKRAELFLKKLGDNFTGAIIGAQTRSEGQSTARSGRGGDGSLLLAHKI